MERYQLIVNTHFCGAHYLRGYEGPCAELHGHNFRVEARVSGSELNEVGMLVDFKSVKGMLKEILLPLDHSVTNDIPPFDQMNPTAEHLARFIYQQLSARLNGTGLKVDSVCIWETDGYGAVYTGGA